MITFLCFLPILHLCTSKMTDIIHRLPKELEIEIYKYLGSSTVLLKLLLDRYPKKHIHYLLERLTIKQLDNAYRYGCMDKLYIRTTNGYSYGSLSDPPNYVQPHLKELFKMSVNNGTQHHEPFMHTITNGDSIYHYHDHTKSTYKIRDENGNYYHDSLQSLAWGYIAEPNFQRYWRTGIKNSQPSKQEYIKEIKKFCDYFINCAVHIVRVHERPRKRNTPGLGLYEPECNLSESEINFDNEIRTIKKRFSDFCDKVSYELMMGILIMNKKNNTV